MIYPHFRGNSSARLKSDLHLKEINTAAKVHLMTKAVCHVDKKARSQQAPLNFRKLLKGRKGHLKFQRNFFFWSSTSNASQLLRHNLRQFSHRGRILRPFYRRDTSPELKDQTEYLEQRKIVSWRGHSILGRMEGLCWDTHAYYKENEGRFTLQSNMICSCKRNIQFINNSVSV